MGIHWANARVRARETVGRALDVVAPPAVASRGSGALPLVALSFDDGPSPANTPELLALLAAEGARATFFAVGDAAEESSDLCRAVTSAGCELGNHTYSHPHTVELSAAALREELRRTNDSLAAAGGSAPALARPPFGKDRRRFARVAAALGLRTVLWTIDSQDTRLRSGREVAEHVLRGVRPGTIVLLHDGGERRPVTLDACTRLVPSLLERGFRLTTVSELLSAPQARP